MTRFAAVHDYRETVQGPEGQELQLSCQLLSRADALLDDDKRVPVHALEFAQALSDTYQVIAPSFGAHDRLSLGVAVLKVAATDPRSLDADLGPVQESDILSLKYQARQEKIDGIVAYLATLLKNT